MTEIDFSILFKISETGVGVGLEPGEPAPPYANATDIQYR